MDIAVPDDDSDDDLKYDLYGAQVAFDNNGNFYEFSAFPKNRISVKRYDLSTRTTQKHDTTFEKGDRFWKIYRRHSAKRSRSSIIRAFRLCSMF